MRKLLINLGTVSVFAIAGGIIYLQNNSFSWNKIKNIEFGKKKSYSKVLFNKVISKSGDKKEYATVTKEYDSFTKKTICKIEPSKKISFSSPTGFDVKYRVNVNPYQPGELSIEFKRYLETQYKFDNEPIKTIKKNGYYGGELSDWVLPNETWTKYKKLTIRDYSADPLEYDYLNKKGKNTEYNLVNFKKAVNKFIKCRKSIGDLAKSWKIGDDKIQIGKVCKYDPVTCRNIQYRWKDITYTKFSNIKDARDVALMKTGYECRSKLEGPFSEEEKQSLLQTMGLDDSDFSDKLVTYLSWELKKYISKDCRSIDDEKILKSANRVMSFYDVEFSPEKVESKIPFEEFSLATGIMSTTQCFAEKGVFKNQKEFLNANLLAFQEGGLPASYALNPLLLKAAVEVKEFLNETCSDFIDPDEKVEDIISKYFEQQ